MKTLQIQWFWRGTNSLNLCWSVCSQWCIKLGEHCETSLTVLGRGCEDNETLNVSACVMELPSTTADRYIDFGLSRVHLVYIQYIYVTGTSAYYSVGQCATIKRNSYQYFIHKIHIQIVICVVRFNYHYSTSSFSPSEWSPPLPCCTRVQERFGLYWILGKIIVWGSYHWVRLQYPLHLTTRLNTKRQCIFMSANKITLLMESSLMINLTLAKLGNLMSANNISCQSPRFICI